MSVLKLTEKNFDEEVIKASKPVIVDFYAEWCGPCKIMSPIVDSISEELGERVKVGKVDSDENMNLAQQYNIMSIPTIMIFKNGEITKTFIGVVDKNEIIKEI